jgi:hypothetical protein
MPAVAARYTTLLTGTDPATVLSAIETALTGCNINPELRRVVHDLADTTNKE